MAGTSVAKEHVTIRKEKASLRQRLWDMMLGANRGWPLPSVEGEDCADLPGELGAETWGQWIGAIEQEWRIRNEILPEFFFRPGNIYGYFSEIDVAVDRLYEQGVRAHHG